MTMLPSGSTETPSGWFSLARVARLPSPVKPVRPSPAKVEMRPVSRSMTRDAVVLGVGNVEIVVCVDGERGGTG